MSSDVKGARNHRSCSKEQRNEPGAEEHKGPTMRLIQRWWLWYEAAVFQQKGAVKENNSSVVATCVKAAHQSQHPQGWIRSRLGEYFRGVIPF